jgi:zinc transport system substrate-binding protein
VKNKKLLTISAITILIIALGAAAIIVAKNNQPPAENSSAEKIIVTTSFYPLYYFASEVGGDKAEVHNITPAGAEPHDYEPTARDMVLIENSRMLILNGLYLEAWGDDIQKNINPQKTKIVIANSGMGQACSIDSSKKMTEKQKTAYCEKQVDPHTWLSPVMAKNIVKNIADGFIGVDPANQKYYEANENALEEKLNNLDADYQKGLTNCQLKDFVTSHEAFGYLAASYGLNQISISGLSPDAEPSPTELAEIVKTVKASNIKYIFFESLISPKLAETIASETGAQTMVLDPLEGLTEEDIANGKNYLTTMEDNLKNLQTALQCAK